jgi:FkbM family methyltransferase
MYHGHKSDIKNIYDLCIDMGENPGVIVDLGAHMGDGYSRLREAFPSARILLVEPMPDCVQVLQSLVDNDSNVSILPFAVGKEEKICQIYCFESDGRQSSNFYSDRGGQYGSPKQIDVEVVTPSSLPSRIDLAKINIEAGEFELLDTDFFDRIDRFVLEAHNSHIPGKSWRDLIEALKDKFDLWTSGNLSYKYCFIMGVKKISLPV